MSKQNIIQEFEKNRSRGVDYSLPSMTELDKLAPPRLFILPTQNELENLLKTVIKLQKAQRDEDCFD